MPRPPGYDLRLAKAALNKRLHAERRWSDYEAIREQLKREGVNSRDAWRIAAQHFPPLDGSEIEVDSPIPAPKVTPKTTPNPTPADDPDPDEFWFDSDAEESAAADPAASPPVPPPAPKSGGWTVYAQDAKGKLLGDAEAWDALIARVDKQARCNERETIDWVFNNALTPVAAIDPEKVPSMGALGLLKMVKVGTNNYTEFVRSVWSKVIPTKSQLESEGRFNDDGRQQLSLLDHFDEQFAEGDQQDAA